MTEEEEKYTTLDTEQCKWWVNTLFSIAKEKACNSHNFDDAEEMQSAQDKIIEALEIVEEFKKAQIITGGRLNGRTYAYKCGLEDGKRKALEQQPSEDCVSRAELLKQIKEWRDCEFIRMTNPYYYLEKRIQSLPPVTPTHGTCKDCKYIYCEHHEETCDIDEYNPNFSCAYFEKRGSEE